MAQLLVIVPTTAGPLIVRKLALRPALPASCAFADGDFRPLPWSADYARLTAKDGPLARLLPEAVSGPHELRLSGSFDAGRSWEAPVALAHLALAAGDTLTDNPASADRVLFATGAVDLDLKVIAGDYALAAKLERTKQLLKELPPHAVLDFRLPPGPGSDEALAMAKEMCGERGVARIMSSVGELDAESRTIAARTGASSQGSAVLPLSLFGAAIVLAGGGWLALGGSWSLMPVPSPPPPVREVSANPVPVVSTPPPTVSVAAEPAIPLLIEELRPAPGGSCRQLVFGVGKPVTQPVPRDRMTFAASQAGQSLCGFRYALTPGSDARFILPPELLAATLAPTTAANGEQIVLLKQNLTQNIVYRVQVFGAGLPSGLTLSHEIRTAMP